MKNGMVLFMMLMLSMISEMIVVCYSILWWWFLRFMFVSDMSSRIVGMSGFCRCIGCLVIEVCVILIGLMLKFVVFWVSIGRMLK